MRATQRIFGLARPAAGVTWEDMLPVMQPEAAHVWSLYEQDVLRDAWVRTDAVGAVYVLETSPGEAMRLLAEQPLVRHGLIEFELVPVGPFIPLSLLFGTQQRPVPPAPTPGLGDPRTVRVLAVDRLRPDVTREDLAPHLADEARHAWSLWKAGIVRETYLRTDRPGAALILEVSGVPGARTVLNELPLVRAGLIEFECLALGAFMGFDALFDGSLGGDPQPLADPARPARPDPPAALTRTGASP